MPPSINSRYTTRVNAWLESHGIRYLDLQNVLGIKRPTISKLFREKLGRGFTLEQAWKMARLHARKTRHPGKITLEWYFGQIGL